MRHLERILTAIIAALFALMIVLVTAQVLNRYGTRFSIPWTEEATRVSYVLLIFVGSALAVIRGNHVAVHSAVLLAPRSVQRILATMSALASAAFFGFVAYGNYIYTLVNWKSSFPTMPFLSIGYVVALVLISSALTAALFVYRAIRPVDPADYDGEELP